MPAEREGNMDSFEGFLYAIDGMLNTKRKRHIAGGILLSASMLFGGLALTVMTIRNEETEEDDHE